MFFFCLKVNSTGFLVQNYENLDETDIDAFFKAFKSQIKSTKIQSNDVVDFLKGMSYKRVDLFNFGKNIRIFTRQLKHFIGHNRH